MASQLDSVAALPDQKTKVDRYRDALNAMVASGSVADLQAFIDHSKLAMSWPLVHFVHGRPYIPSYACTAAKLSANKMHEKPTCGFAFCIAQICWP